MQSGLDEVIIALRTDPGFHINANPASEPYLIPTTLSVNGVVPLDQISESNTLTEGRRSKG